MTMCNAFSCIVDQKKNVTWEFGIDSHDQLLKIAGLPDDTLDPEKIRFCRVEISPKNKSYLEPDEWVFKIDMDVTPKWWTLDHKKACEIAHREWMDQLYKILVRKAIVHPFNITPPKRITKKHLVLLKEWTSVWKSVGASVWKSVWKSVGASVWKSVGASVWDSVGASVGASVWKSVGASVGASVWDSVGASVWDSVGASVGAYSGSFFLLPRDAWKYTKNIKTDEYPFLPLVKLWEMGMVPSFDGKKWRLHGGPDAKILWEGVI